MESVQAGKVRFPKILLQSKCIFDVTPPLVVYERSE
jgi:CheY-specific phosphatase CheX